MTLDEKRVKIEKKYRDELWALEVETRIRQALPGTEEYYCMVLVSELYGSQGLVSYGPQPGMPVPDRKLLEMLLTQYPPVPVIKAKGAYTSFQPEIRQPLLTGLDITEVEPVRIDIGTIMGEVAFQWYADINGELWRFDVEFPWSTCKIGEARRIVTRYDKRTGQDEAWKWVLSQEPGVGAKQINWAGDNSERPTGANFTLYWLRDEADTRGVKRFLDLVKEV